jgi:endonuclease/exonuclease/phosphatase
MFYSMRIRTIFHAFSAVITAVCALLLLVSYLAAIVSPADFWIPGLLGLVSPILLAINLITLIYWLVQWKSVALIPAVAIVLGLPLFVDYFRFRPPHPPYEGSYDFSVMSYNVNLFRLYSWANSPSTELEVAALYDSLGADILCLQEFYTDSTKFPERDAIQLFGPNAHIHYTSRLNGRMFGLGTFTRLPIVDSGTLEFPGSFNATIFTDVVCQSDTIRIYNTHLQSFRLQRHNLAFLRSPKFDSAARPLMEMGDIAHRLRTALRLRAQQVAMLRRHIERSPYPVVLCGDFNDSPISYSYRHLRSLLHDAFSEAGTGFGSTFNGIFPSYRIDYILYDNRFKALDFRIPQVDYSDHLPTFCPFMLAKGN